MWADGSHCHITTFYASLRGSVEADPLAERWSSTVLGRFVVLFFTKELFGAVTDFEGEQLEQYWQAWLRVVPTSRIFGPDDNGPQRIAVALDELPMV